MQVQTITRPGGQQQTSKPRYDLEFVPHPKLGAPYMVPVVLDQRK